VVCCPDNALSNPGIITIAVIAEHLNIHQARITAQTGYAHAVVGYGSSDPGDMCAVTLTVGIRRAAIGEIDTGYYFICQIRVVYIDAGIEDSDNDVLTTFGYAPSLRSLNFCHSPLQVKGGVIGNIHSLSYTINLNITHHFLHIVRCHLRGPLPTGHCDYLNSNLRECRFNTSAFLLVHLSHIVQACARLKLNQQTFRKRVTILTVIC